MRLAAEKGNVDAQVNLGVMYAQGQGVTQDYKKAYKWANIANENGGKAIEFRKKLETKMTDSQIKKAKEVAKEWMEIHEY